MEERTSYAIAGVFVLLAVIVTVGFIVWMSGGRATQATDVYTVVFDRDVSGLNLGSPVRYLGVDVGEVTAMDLITDGATRVGVEVAIASNTPVDQGTYASLAYLGITGVAYIGLAADAGQHAPITTVGGEEHPVIPSRDVGLPALLADSGSISDEVESLLVELRDLLEESNRASVSRSLSNLATLTDALVAERTTIAALPRRLEEGIEELRRTLDQAGALLERAEPELLETMAQLNETTANTARLTARIEGWLGSHEATLDTFAAEGLRALPPLVAEVRGSIRELDALLASLRANPSQLVYQPQRNAVRVDP